MKLLPHLPEGLAWYRKGALFCVLVITATLLLTRGTKDAETLQILDQVMNVTAIILGVFLLIAFLKKPS